MFTELNDSSIILFIDLRNLSIPFLIYILVKEEI